MVKEDRRTWKSKYFDKVNRTFDEYNKVFIVGIDNVRSKQMQQIRKSLRGEAELVMGKNTMMKKAMRTAIQKNPDIERLLPFLKMNVGLVFTNEDCTEIKDRILENRVAAPAKAGALAPLDVTVPAQNTGLGPEKTSFFQALQIPTKITRGTIEILNDVKLIKAGDKVGASEATLLNMLKISPFTYGLLIEKVYDAGSIYDPEVLSITNDDLINAFRGGLSNIASLSMAINYPCMASAPHMVANALKNMMALSIATDYPMKEAEKAKEYLKDPSKFAATAAPVKAETGAAKKEEKKKEEPEEEEDEDFGMGLFD